MKQLILLSVPATLLALTLPLVPVQKGWAGLSWTGSPPNSAPNGAKDKQSSAAAQILSETSDALNEVAQKAVPAVVSISTIKRVDPLSALSDDDDSPLGGPPSHLGGPSDLNGAGKSAESRLHGKLPALPRVVTVGSGVIIDPRGYILTNHHVVEGADRITVTFDEKHKLDASLVGDDPSTDLAVIKLREKPPGELTALAFGDSDQIKVGDWAIAVGSPFGLKRTVTMGIISAKGRGRVGILDTEDFIQTDAALNPGSSGGPLLDVHGDVIGLNTAIYSQTGGFIGIGFAVPSKIAKSVAEELIAHGRVSRSWLGLSAQDLDSKLAGYFKTPSEQGALVTQITQNSPASDAGFKPGDVVLAFDHGNIEDAAALKATVTKGKRGTPIDVDILRDGHHETRQVLLREAPAPQLAGQVPGPALVPERDPDFGATARDLVPELARFLKMPPNTGAILTEIRPGTPAYDAGLTAGDVVLKADGHDIRGARDFTSMVRGLRKNRAVVLYVQRGPNDSGEKLFVPVDGT